MSGRFSLSRIAVLGLGILMMGGMVGVEAQPASRADTLTADAAVQRALTENPRIQAARQNRTAAAASVREARSEWFPVVEGQARYRRLSENVDYTVDLPTLPGSGGGQVTFAPAILNRYAAQARVEQPLFTGFRISNQLDAAQAQTRAARARVGATRTTVAYETRAAYWRLYEAQAREQAATDALQQIERQLTDVQNRQDEGMVTETDVLRVQARRDQVRVEQIQAQNDVQTARRRLNDMLRRPLDAPVVLADTVTIDAPALPDSSTLVARAQAQRGDLEALRQTVSAREAEVDVAQSGWYPQISLFGSYLYARPNEQLFPPEDQFEGSWEAGVTLSWRLSVGGQTDAATDRAQARRLAAEYELQDRRQAVTVDVRTQVQNVHQAREAVRAAETSVQSAQEAYRSTRSRYEEGMAVVSDLLDAEQARRQSRARLAAAQAEYAIAQAALDRALGRGGEAESP